MSRGRPFLIMPTGLWSCGRLESWRARRPPHLDWAHLQPDKQIPQYQSMKYFTPALALAGLSMFTLLGAGGCAGFGRPTYGLEQTLSPAHISDMPIQVKSRNGTISIQSHAGSAVEITARLRSMDEQRVHDAQISAVRDTDGTLAIGVTWPEGKRHSNDGCSFDILVPDANGVSVRTSNGRITLAGLSGALDARTTNGRITISSHDGPINVNTTNGRIVITDATSAVAVDTTNGAIKVSLTDDNPGPVNLDTSNGQVTLAVGPAFVGTLSADTSNGRVHFGPFPDGYAVSNLSVSKSEGSALFGGHASTMDSTATFGDSNAAESIVDTSNGSVTVKGRS